MPASLDGIWRELGEVRSDERRMGRRVAAERMRRFLAALPDQPDILVNVARQLAVLHRHQDVITLACRAEHAAGQDPRLGFMIAHLHWLAEQPAEALERYRVLLSSDLDRAPILTEMALAQASLGDTEAARASLAAAIEADPKFIPAYLDLSSLDAAASAHFIDTLESMRRAGARLPFDWAARLDHALGNLYDAEGQHAEAFAAYVNAKRGLSAGPPFNEADLAHRHELAAHLASRDLSGGGAASRAEARPIILVVGMPRSGTTLADSALVRGYGASDAGEGPALMDAHEAWLHKRGANDASSRQALMDAGDDYVASLLADAPYLADAKAIIDKTPTNYLALGLAYAACPTVRLVHCVRDPIDVCWSCFTTWFRTPVRWANDLAAIGRMYGRYEALMQAWRCALGDALVEIKYEDMVRDHERTVAQAALRCGLAASATQRGRGAVFTPSMNQVRKPVYTSSLGRSRSYLHYLEPLIDALQQADVPLTVS